MDTKKILREIKLSVFNRKLTCNLCSRENFNGEYFCDNCLSRLVKNDGYICDHCGAPLEYPSAYCDTCADKNLSFSYSRSAFIYTGEVKKLIRDMKFNGKAYLADIFAKYAYEKFIKCGYNADIIVYIPMTKRRERKRGYNQSRLMAEEISALSGIKIGYGIVEKRETETNQVGLTRSERRRNLTGSFLVKDKLSIKDKTVLVVDDVMTTGSTLECISAELKKAGAKEVIALTAAVTARKFSVDKHIE